MHACIHTTYIHTYIHTHTYIYLCTHTHIYIHIICAYILVDPDVRITHTSYRKMNGLGKLARRSLRGREGTRTSVGSNIAIWSWKNRIVMGSTVTYGHMIVNDSYMYFDLQCFLYLPLTVKPSASPRTWRTSWTTPSRRSPQAVVGFPRFQELETQQRKDGSVLFPNCHHGHHLSDGLDMARQLRQNLGAAAWRVLNGKKNACCVLLKSGTTERIWKENFLDGWWIGLLMAGWLVLFDF